MDNDDDITKKQVQEIFNPIRECPYTQEQLDEMRALGLPKPPEVSWPSWMGPKNESSLHEALMYAKASGATNKAIAQQFNYTESRISIIMNKPEIKKKIRALQEKYWGGNIEARFQNLLPKAVEVAANIINSKTEKTSLKADVAFKLMDRALGKPQQSIAVEGNLLADLIHRLDQQEARDVTNPEIQSERVEDHVDEKVNNFLGDKEFTVGKRNKDG